MRKLVLLLILLLAFDVFPQMNGGWKLGGGLDAMGGILQLRNDFATGFCPNVSTEYLFPFSYFSCGASLGILIAPYSSFRITAYPKIQFGNSAFGAYLDNSVYIPIGGGDNTPSVMAGSGLSLTAKVSSITVIKFGFGAIYTPVLENYPLYLNLGITMQGDIGY